jgi:leucyl aminopeptidase
MEINAATGNLAVKKVDAIIVSHHDGIKSPEGDAAAADKALDGAIAGLIKQGDIKGKLNEVTLIHSLGKLPAGRVIVLGLGKKADLTLNKIRNAIAEVCRYLRNKHVSSIASGVFGAGVEGFTTPQAVQAMTEGILLGLYTFRRYITKKENNAGEVKTYSVVGTEKGAITGAIEKGKVLAEGTVWARDLVNEPSNFMTPTLMAQAANEVAKKYELKIEIFEKDKIKEMGMGGLMGVSQGSQQPPRFIVLSYKGRTAKDLDLALVGKGITFDSGGIDLKGQEGMDEMKGDMSGGASVIATLAALARLKPKINVTALVPATENMPGGTALKPGDIITAMNGETIEVLNTDAEGRLILADALSYAKKLNAKAIVDVATLTGACHVALGSLCSGAFTNDQALADKVIATGKESGELMWQLPMYEEYRDLLKSDIADIKNIGSRWGGAITAAKFLEDFVDKTPWVHLDIAGTYYSDKEKGYLTKGATGVPVRTLVNLALALAR